MFARYDRMAKAFSRCGREIVIAVKAGGPDPDLNPTLRRAIQNARAANMPKDKIENAVKRALGPDTANYEEVIYEGYAPHGIALLVLTTTDNPTRTVANVRVCFNKGNGNIGTTGTVNYLFTKMCVFRLVHGDEDLEELELDLIDYGLEELGESEDDKGNPQILIRGAFNDFGNLQSAIEDRGLKVVSSDAEYVPSTMTELPEDQAEEVMELIAKLEEDDDVQTVFHNLS
ncbi:MAG: YebC/PmpR family DNA-binding regulatory protein [Bradymonadia bacterium]|jgi:YebC/PmpR family DNA-binding regulatory protein